MERGGVELKLRRTLRGWALAMAWCLLFLPAAAQPSEGGRVYLSGTDKDHTVDWDFFCTKGRRSGQWTTIPVPSQWELQGFGNYAYGWWNDDEPDEEGKYRHRFKVPPAWKGQRVFLTFEGAMTDTEVFLNGQSAGPRQHGGFIAFRFEVGDKLNYGEENLLEATVSKVSQNQSVNLAEKRADYWNFGGIYRPVYLQVQPPGFVDRVAVDARHDGAFQADIFIDAAKTGDRIQAKIFKDGGGRVVGSRLRGEVGADGQVRLEGRFKKVLTWTAEMPHLYTLNTELLRDGKVLHIHEQSFGFRSFELRPHDGLYVNGKRVILKGVNRHSFWPDSGRTLSEEIHRKDIELIQGMNMNAVRMAHYPPDERFLELCDEMGLYVIDEIAGWQAAYDDENARRAVRAMVTRDINHPGILFWANGNEGGWNPSIESVYTDLDPQKRPVLRPWLRFNGIDTKHYPDYNYVAESALRDQDVFMPTEFMHALYDQGGAAGLKDFWSMMRRHPRLGGGFIWALVDEGVIRTDQEGRIDAAGNAGADGLVGPYREKEGGYEAVREIWSPIQIEAPSLNDGFDGQILVENRHHFTNLSQCRFEWKLLSLPDPMDGATQGIVLARGEAVALNLKPGEKGWLDLKLSADWRRAQVLALSATDPRGREVFEWTWPVQRPQQQAIPSWKAGDPPFASEAENFLLVTCDKTTWRFDKSTGELADVERKTGSMPMAGPRLVDRACSLKSLNYRREGSRLMVEPVYIDDDKFHVTWIFESGRPPKLEYRYEVKSASANLGIVFDLPRESVTGMTWRGRGPFRVWRNRLAGPRLGVWHKEANDTRTGMEWNYPEFRGYHADLFWVRVHRQQGDFTVYTTRSGTFLQMLRPAAPDKQNNGPVFPEGDLGFLTAISPVGTKFQKAGVMGPSGNLNHQISWEPESGTLYFDFR